jgi:hypothetical protein
LEEPSDTQMLGMQDGLRTPGVCLLLVTSIELNNDRCFLMEWNG